MRGGEDAEDLVGERLTNCFNPREIEKHLFEAIESRKDPTGLRTRHEKVSAILSQAHRHAGSRECVIITFWVSRNLAPD